MTDDVSSRAFSGVTATTVDRIKQSARDQHGIIFDPPAGTAGTATAHTRIGKFVMGFVHDNEKSTLVLTLIEKPFLLPAAVLWNGLSAEIDRIKNLP